MIRYVHIGNQIEEDENQFSFFDTRTGLFIEIQGTHYFDSIDDLECAIDSCSETNYDFNRLSGLIQSNTESTGESKRIEGALEGYLNELEHNLSCVDEQSEGKVRFNVLEIQSWINDMNKIILQPQGKLL